MRLRLLLLFGVTAAFTPLLIAQVAGMKLPQTVEAGSPFSVESLGNGNAVLYIIGPAQALRRNVQLGKTVAFPAGTMCNAGHYLAVLVAGSFKTEGSFDVVPAATSASLSLLAKPSRLPVALQNGITGAVYVFDAYQNLITIPVQVSFVLSNPSGPEQTRTVKTRNGAAWTAMNSATRAGSAQFTATVNNISSKRVIQQVAGDPCSLKFTARTAGQKIVLQTDPLRDCNGNAVPDGTIVTFTETTDGKQTTADVPLKRGVAQVEMPARQGARITAASGVVLGNEIRLGS